MNESTLDKIDTLYWIAHTDGTQDDINSKLEFRESIQALIRQEVLLAIESIEEANETTLGVTDAITAAKTRYAGEVVEGPEA